MSQTRTSDDAVEIARRFDLQEPITARPFPGKGNIHGDTFLVTAGGREYILQRINQLVFTRPYSVMAAMMACVNAQREYIAEKPLPPGSVWTPITLVTAESGEPFLNEWLPEFAGVWRMMVRIPDTRTYLSLSEISDPAERLRIAEEAGKGLALYGDLTSAMDISGLENPLPGYRDTRNYYNQFKAVLAGCRTPEQAAQFLPTDPITLRGSELHFYLHIPDEEYARRMADPAVKRFVELALQNEPAAMRLAHAMQSGEIRTLAIHGDTKLDNFLFCSRTGRVKAMVDLDTIMPHTWLSDWGDMVRSLVNVAGEREPDMARVQVDMEIYRAVARGFLSTAKEVTPQEVALMVEAIQALALELGVRFLMDYLRGDSYFKPGEKDPPDVNRTRGMVQLTLFERLREREGEMRSVIEESR